MPSLTPSQLRARLGFPRLEIPVAPRWSWRARPGPCSAAGANFFPSWPARCPLLLIGCGLGFPWLACRVSSRHPSGACVLAGVPASANGDPPLLRRLCAGQCLPGWPVSAAGRSLPASACARGTGLSRSASSAAGDSSLLPRMRGMGLDQMGLDRRLPGGLCGIPPAPVGARQMRLPRLAGRFHGDRPALAR